MKKPLLEVKGLKTEFRLAEATVHAVNEVSFTVNEGEVLGIVGESGCGKSVTALSIMRLIEHPGYIVGGQILLHDGDQTIDIARKSMGEMVNIRGVKLSMIFQDPMTSLNPVLNVGYQIMEPLKLHRHMSDKDATDYAIRLLERVGIPEAKLRLKEFPHQFSGGMRQRVMIAIAVACSPRLLFADEPTTALDVTIQAQIIDLLRDLKDELGTSVIIITHDLGVIAQMADQVAVMYAGNIVENGPSAEIYENPQHPYTRALMGSIPRLRNWPERLTTIEGAPPSLTSVGVGCPFEPRCILRVERCAIENPRLLEIYKGHTAACWVAQEGAHTHA
ncbi:MAG: ABC transporter ATP-binding protein [Omnitrophica WOR_2 bacterium]